MSTFVQWVHVSAVVIGVGSIAFMLLILLPSAQRVNPEQRDILLKSVSARFRWAVWTIILLILASGIFMVRQFYWEVAWGRSWKVLSAKIILALVIFAISFCLTIPLGFFERFQKRRKLWMSISLALALVVILLSAYLRRG